MEAPSNNFLETCLFFNTNAFSRHLVKLAEGVFKDLKLSPAHASLLLLVYETPGISPKDLSRLLQLNPSTITRFIDALVKKKLLRRQAKGKTAAIHPTKASLAIKADVANAYKKLILTYSEILGSDEALRLSQMAARANERMMAALSSQSSESFASPAPEAPPKKAPDPEPAQDTASEHFSAPAPDPPKDMDLFSTGK